MWRHWTRRVIEILKDENGHEILEYTLLTTFIIMPLTHVVPFLVDVLRAYYAMTSFIFSLPVP
jgi:hypothetical protein